MTTQTPDPNTFLKKILLIGNPNCGKTTIFNGLTGAKQKVGNWSGVTVEKKSGTLRHHPNIEVLDLPGIYSLTAHEHTAIDERIASQAILSEPANLWVNIVDANSLERHLYLSLQLKEMGQPMLLVLNMTDVARARGKIIQAQLLSDALQCPVILISAKQKKQCQRLEQVIFDIQNQSFRFQNNSDVFFPKNNMNNLEKKSLDENEIFQGKLQNCIHQLAEFLKNSLHDKSITLPNSLQTGLKDESAYFFLATRLLEGDHLIRSLFPMNFLEKIEHFKNTIETQHHTELDLEIANARYQFIHTLIQHCQTQAHHPHQTWTARLDNIVLNRFLGIPIFLFVMYALFFFAINIGGAFQDFFDQASDAIFTQGLAQLCQSLHFPIWLTALLANGIGKGIHTTLTFAPVLAGLFLFLSFLEDSGYMARAAFVADRFMQYLGLSGKALVPLIVGFGCNVPAVMGARTLEHERHRILSILMAPFMACGARLAIFAVFTAAFFQNQAANIVFVLYLIGISVAIFTGWMLKKTVLKTLPAPFLMELPPYHLPQLKSLILHTWQRLRGFILRAGKLIIPICMIIGILNAINLDGGLNTGEASTQSILSAIGKFITPLFSPMGITADNWPATVGLFTGILAKEVVIGTLNALYTQMGHLPMLDQQTQFHLGKALLDAAHTIPDNFMTLKNALSNPILAKAPMQTVSQGVYGEMAAHFHGKMAAFSYLLFVLLYIPCISTIAVIKRELSTRYAVFASAWMMWVAYGISVCAYQASFILQTPLKSSLWIITFIASFILIWHLLKKYGTAFFHLSPSDLSGKCANKSEGCSC